MLDSSRYLSPRGEPALLRLSVLAGCDADDWWRCVREGCGCWLIIRFQCSAATCDYEESLDL